MKKIDRSMILNICAILLFVAGIITFAVGDNNPTGFLFTSTGFLFLMLGISSRRQEDAKAEETKETEEKVEEMADEDENK